MRTHASQFIQTANYGIDKKKVNKVKRTQKQHNHYDISLFDSFFVYISFISILLTMHNTFATSILMAIFQVNPS